MAKKKATKKAETKKAPAKKAKTKKAVSEEDADEKPVKKKRKTRKKKTEEARLKIYWGVFNHAMKRVALYEFNQRKAAEKRAKELSPEGKPPHFVQKVKQEVVDEVAVDDPDAAPKKKATKKKAKK